jgi:hypothetical protein
MDTQKTKTLYEQDFYLWIAETVQQLKSGDFSHLDLDNLIEEIESLGKTQRKTVRSFLVRLLEHLLKRCFVPLPNCYRGWEIEIRNFRRELKQELLDSPSLNNFMSDILAESYQDALIAMREDYPAVDFPDICPYPVAQLLNRQFWY